MTKAKIKGNAWEHDATILLNQLLNGAEFKRIPGSGALGTSFGEPLLTGDLSGRVNGIKQKFKVECKVGYDSSSSKEIKQFVIKKAWLDKIVEEAGNAYAIPMLFAKFSGARSGVKHFVVLDIETFSRIINELSRLGLELENRDEND